MSRVASGKVVGACKHVKCVVLEGVYHQVRV